MEFKMEQPPVNIGPKISEKSFEIIKSEPVGIDESVFHEDIEKVIGEWLNKQDILVRSAIDRLFHRAFSMLSEKLDEIDLDDKISEDEKRAWINLFQAIYDAAKTTKEYYERKKSK